MGGPRCRRRRNRRRNRGRCRRFRSRRRCRRRRRHRRRRRRRRRRRCRCRCRRRIRKHFRRCCHRPLAATAAAAAAEISPPPPKTTPTTPPPPTTTPPARPQNLLQPPPASQLSSQHDKPTSLMLIPRANIKLAGLLLFTKATAQYQPEFQSKHGRKTRLGDVDRPCHCSVAAATQSLPRGPGPGQLRHHEGVGPGDQDFSLQIP